MELTKKEIIEDIQTFEDRILLNKQKLSRLPVGPLSYQKHKEREKQQRDLLDDIRHYEQIIEYAKEAIE